MTCAEDGETALEAFKVALCASTTVCLTSLEGPNWSGFTRSECIDVPAATERRRLQDEAGIQLIVEVAGDAVALAQARGAADVFVDPITQAAGGTVTDGPTVSTELAEAC